MSVVHATSWGHRKSEGYVELACPSKLWKSWPCSLLDSVARELALILMEDLDPILSRDGPTSYYGKGRTDLDGMDILPLI